VQIFGWMDVVNLDVHLAALLRQGTDLHAVPVVKLKDG